MKPTLGRIVHYTMHKDRSMMAAPNPPKVLPAIIVEAVLVAGADDADERSYAVYLNAFTTDGVVAIGTVPFSKYPAGSEEAQGCWSWPEKV